MYTKLCLIDLKDDISVLEPYILAALYMAFRVGFGSFESGAGRSLMRFFRHVIRVDWMFEEKGPGFGVGLDTDLRAKIQSGGLI